MNSPEVMSESEAYEIQGRLALWVFTLKECKRLLKLAARSKDAATQERLELQQERMRGLQNLGPKNASPISGDPDGLNAYQRFNQDNPQYYAFPTYHDCTELSGCVHMYAIIAFCRIWTTGNQGVGKAMGNKTEKMKALREKMVAEAFPEASDRQNFDAFLNQLLVARDKVIAHADGDHANIRFNEGLSLTLPSNVVHGIDMKYFAQCVELLYMRCHAYP